MQIRALVIVFFLPLMAFSSFKSSCDTSEILIATNHSLNDTAFFQNGKRIVIVTRDEEKFKGKLKIENDSTICIDNESIEIENINYIKGIKTKKRKNGEALLALGTLTSAGGIMLIALRNSTSNNGYAGIGFLLAGAGLEIISIPLWTGGLITTSKECKYDKMKRWKHEIIN